MTSTSGGEGGPSMAEESNLPVQGHSKQKTWAAKIGFRPPRSLHGTCNQSSYLS